MQFARIGFYGLLIVAGVPIQSFSLSPPDGEPSRMRITALSTRPDKVTGGDALVRIDVPPGMYASEIVLRRNGEDVSSVLQPQPDGRSLVGLIAGLALGRNVLEATTAGEEQARADLVINNYPIEGPVFSGPQEQPFLCETESFRLPDGRMLPPPLDEKCSVRTDITYVYRSTGDASGFRPLPDLKQLPSDVAWTTTTVGHRVPYVVRVETGTINRAIFQIALLHDPASEEMPSPFRDLAGWNRRLLFSFGGGCIGGWFKQGSRLGGTGNLPGLNLVSDAIVGKGYAHASSTLNVFGNNCNDVLAAETMMMVKEHFIERYGEPAFTFGRGGSGGAYQQIQIADNYPGLLDGIIPGATFTDVLATIQFLTDIQLLDRFFASQGETFSEEQRRAISGVGNVRTIESTAAGANRIKAPGVCPPELPQSLRYDPDVNPGGARCNVFDHTVNVYGRDPSTGFARRPVDNTGVQYGLHALNTGIISASQFLELNESIGGYDNDGKYIRVRSQADPVAVASAHQTGRTAYGGKGLAQVPIIDARSYLDLKPSGDLHLKYHSFAFRERLRRANGTFANNVLLVTGPKAHRGFDEYTIAKMDEWLTNLRRDTSAEPIPSKIQRARPADLVDSCYTETGERIVEPQTFSGGKCNALYPTFPSPRMVAGGPVTNDVLKCQLKPIDFRDYSVQFTDEQKARLQSVFPDGVCDWSKPGVDQVPPRGTWLSF